MLPELLLAVGIGLIAYSFYKWMTLNNDYFSKRNLPFEKPKMFFGSTFEMFSKITAMDFSQKLYNNFPNEKMYGRFDFRKPIVIVRDKELLKQLAVKGFDHFEDHQAFIDPSTDDLFGSSLFMMKGQRWRDMRATLSPAFTGSKMRQMFDLVTECAEETMKFSLQQSAEGKQIDLEMKDFFSRYTTDVLATCAYGIRINSIENPNNEFFLSGKKFKFGSFNSMVRFFFVRAVPSLAKKLDVQLIPSSVRTFFSRIIIETIEEREKRGIVRHDMINILMQLRQGKLTAETAAEKVQNAMNDSAGFATVDESEIGLKAPVSHWTDKDLIAQAFLFFLGGFETTSNVLTFLSYELCVNPDIQQKLYEEIADSEKNLGGKRINYDTLQRLKYLDQVVSESLRKWPPFVFLDRLCVKDFDCEYDNGKSFRFEKGIIFMNPTCGMHRDPNYFPDPERFDPERFSDENKDNIEPGTYLPFGIGPRNCIGSRFALMEVKAIIYYILLNFTVVPNAKSQIPLRMLKNPFNVATEKGVHVTFAPRK